MVQDEVMWVLETIRENWSGEYPENLYRINRDEPKVLETGIRTKSVDFTQGVSTLGASLASRSTSPIGTEYNHAVETVVSIRVEGLHAGGGKWGHVEDSQHFNQLVASAKRALYLERTYPTIDADDDLGRVDYFELQIENEQPQSSGNEDYYRTDFDVRLTGDEKLP